MQTQLVLSPFRWQQLLKGLLTGPAVFEDFAPDATLAPSKPAPAGPRPTVRITVQAGITVLDDVRSVVHGLLGIQVCFRAAQKMTSQGMRALHAVGAVTCMPAGHTLKSHPHQPPAKCFASESAPLCCGACTIYTVAA